MAPPASSTRRGKLRMIGWPTPTVEPFFGTNEGGPKGGVPVNGVGSCPAAGPATTGCAPGKGNGGGGASGSAGGGASTGSGAGAGAGAATAPGSPGAGSGSASAGTALRTSAPLNTEANPAAFRAAKRLLLVEPDICIPPVAFSEIVWHSARTSYALRGARRTDARPGRRR